MNEVWRARVALSRAGARVAGSGPGGENLAASTWQRLETLPDPRSPQGRIYPLACLIAIAVCAFTAAGNDLCVPKTCATWVDASTGSRPRSAVSGTLLAMLA